MIPAELAKKIRALEIHTSRAASDVLAGEYHSVFKGRGMEFDTVREYAPGDEIRTIDWNVTARMGRPFVKRFVEERELTLMLLVDLSASGAFGTADQTKNEVAAEFCALLAFSAIKNNDKVGLIAFTDEVELFIPPAKGSTHVLRVIREILAFRPKGRGTCLQAGLDYLGRVQHRSAVVFLLSDFFDKGYETALQVASRRHDLIAVTLTDRHEQRLPPMGLLHLEDAETGEQIQIDTGSLAARLYIEGLARERRDHLRNFLRTRGIDQIEIHTGQDYVARLIQFFRKRERHR